MPLTIYFQIIIMSLKLFETLLKKPHEHIITNLVLRNLESRVYIDRTALPPPPPATGEEAAKTDENGDGDGAVAGDGDAVASEENTGHTNQDDENQEIDPPGDGENEGEVDGEKIDGEQVDSELQDRQAGGDTQQSDSHKLNSQVENQVEMKQESESGPSNPTEQVIDRTEPLMTNEQLDQLFTNGPDTLASEILGTNEIPEPTSPLFDLSPIHSPVSLLPAKLGSPTHSDISATPSASSVDSEDGLGIQRIVNW